MANTAPVNFSSGPHRTKEIETNEIQIDVALERALRSGAGLQLRKKNPTVEFRTKLRLHAVFVIVIDVHEHRGNSIYCCTLRETVLVGISGVHPPHHKLTEN